MQPFRCGRWLRSIFRKAPTRSAGRTASAVSSSPPCARTRHQFAGGGGAGQDCRAGAVAIGLLAGLGRAVREPGRGAPAADDRRARLLLSDLSIAVHRPGFGSRRLAGLQRRAARSPAAWRRSGSATYRFRSRPPSASSRFPGSPCSAVWSCWASSASSCTKATQACRDSQKVP